MSTILREVKGDSSDLSAVAGIHTGDRFVSIHQVTDRKARQSISLAGQRLSQISSVARRNAIEIAKVWALMDASSADFAELTQLTGGNSTVIFGKYGIRLARSVHDINGAVSFINTASMVVPDETGQTLGKATFTTQASYQGECIASGEALLVIDPFPTRLQIASARVVRRPSNILQEFPAYGFEITQARSERTFQVSDDQQALHDKNAWVARNEEGDIQYDQTGKVIIYRGLQRKDSDERYGRLTRFGDSIAPGVLSSLIDLGSLTTRLEGLAERGTHIDIQSADLKFIGPVEFGSTLRIDQWLTEVLATNGEAQPYLGGKLREGSLRLVTACSTEKGAAVESSFVVKLS
ncbi:hypothetical protein HY383_04595 [Candidatus Daviesbacteria bacterium]|nr:hypothetical protein [Candidatus Daviesbacteria bacterium]